MKYTLEDFLLEKNNLIINRDYMLKLLNNYDPEAFDYIYKNCNDLKKFDTFAKSLYENLKEIVKECKKLYRRRREVAMEALAISVKKYYDEAIAKVQENIDWEMKNLNK